MDCAACATKVDRAARRVRGIHDVSVLVAAQTLVVEHETAADLAEMERRIAGLGYQIQLHGEAVTSAIHDHAHHETGDGRWWMSPQMRLTIVCGLALAMAFVLAMFVPAYGSWAYLAAMAVGLVPIARRAVMAALRGTFFTIETLMSVAALGAVAIDAAEEAAVVVFLFVVGEVLEGVAAGRARAGIRNLVQLVPRTAFIEEEGKLREVLAETLVTGVTIVARPGDRIAADGVILAGDTSIDESLVTGESVPAVKRQGDQVYAGTINLDAVIRIEVTAAAHDNTISRIVRLVEEAQESKAPTQRFINGFSRYYTPGVMIVALTMAVFPPLAWGGDWYEWIYKGLAVLLIGCPCALVISTPAAIAAGLSAGARRGLLMKGGVVLETLAKVTKVAFDKTGTLTAGRPQVTDIIGCDYSEADVLRLAAALEAGSAHPLALAILAQAALRDIEPPAASDARLVGGEGVDGKVEGRSLFLGSVQAAEKRVSLTGQLQARIAALSGAGKTVSLLLADGKIAGFIAMRDEPREDARAGIALLRKLGIGALMLTGDNRHAAEAVADGLGLEFAAELMPQDKQRIVGELRLAGEIVAKVGDGINDAPALAAANVGIAMGGGTDVALETADAAVLHGRVSDVAGMVALSRATMSNIRWNIAIALGLKLVFLITTALGLTGLWPAILADTGATVLVTANAMRLLAWRG